MLGSIASSGAAGDSRHGPVTQRGHNSSLGMLPLKLLQRRMGQADMTPHACVGVLDPRVGNGDAGLILTLVGVSWNLPG